MSEPVVSVRKLDFRYRAGHPLVLHECSVDVEQGSRCLVIGANGAGKTTLLRVIGGKHLISPESVRVLGRSAFHDTQLAADIEYLGGGFTFAVDMRVAELIEALPAVHSARCEHIRQILGVDPDWHMHRVSDGQRRRVQLLLGLTRPRRILLLDEITTDLDLLARQDLLDFLTAESGGGVTVLYATHILDRLEDWASHVCMMRAGKVVYMGATDGMPGLAEARASGEPSPLYSAVLGWLRRTA